MLGRLLFWIARRPATGALVGLGFARLAPLLPVRRLLLSRSLIAFWHPRPSWPGHILIVPRVALPTLLALAERRPDLIDEVAEAARELISGLDMAAGYTLCANGGPRQDVGQVHFHLYAEGGPTAPVALAAPPAPPCPRPHPYPAWTTHLIIQGGPSFAARLAPLPALARAHDLVRRGYTVYLSGLADGEVGPPTLHVTAGDRLSAQ